jgi:prepilin-type N-terminal cleavage/methylation domain-containing protein
MRRSAFTLVELLVVIAILALLTALTVGAVMRVAGTAQSKASKTAVSLVSDVLQKQWKGLVDRAKDEPIPTAIHDKIKTNLAGSDVEAEKRVRVIYIKLKLKQTFPQTFSEILSPGPYDLTPLNEYKQQLADWGVNAAPATPAAYESAACLLMALRLGKGDTTGVNQDQLNKYAARFGQVEALVDGWGTPLAYCRWPVNCAQLNPNGATTGNNDKEDPSGLLTANNWLTTAYRTNFQTYLHTVANRANNAPMTYTLKPIIVSAGPDRTLGLDINNTLKTSNATAEADNIYSSQLLP